MADEAIFNTYLKNSLNLLPSFMSHKMQDLGHGKGIAKPYDLYAEFKNGFMAVEGKKLKNLQSFNFNCFESQQLPSLYHAFCNNHIALVALYIEIPRHSYMLLFCVSLIIKLIKEQNKNSILKKELEKLVNKYSFPLKKKLFDLSNYQEKIIKELV